MTDTQTPERIWLDWEGPHKADHSLQLEPYSFDCSTQHEFIRLDLHAAVVAERDQLKAMNDEKMQHIRELKGRIEALENTMQEAAMTELEKHRA